MKGAAQLFPVGRWSSDHFALFDSLTGGKPGGDQCPGELTADTCAAYLPPGTIIEGGFQSEVPWRELYETRDLPVYVNGTRVGSWNPDDTGRYARYTYPGGQFVSGDSPVATLGFIPWPQIARNAGPGRIEFEYAIATRVPVSPVSSWELVDVTEAQIDEIEAKVRAFIEQTYESNARAGLGDAMYRSSVVFRSGANSIEFASATFESLNSDDAYGISLAWGLSAVSEPVVFHPLQVTGSDPYPHFFHLIQATDLGADGTIELLLEFNNNHQTHLDVWQGTEGRFRRVGYVSFW